MRRASAKNGRKGVAGGLESSPSSRPWRSSHRPLSAGPPDSRPDERVRGSSSPRAATSNC